MASHLVRRNDALDVNTNTQNGKHVDIAITVQGSDFYFAICTIMGCVALTVLALSYRKPRTDRIFFYITAALNSTACIAYFTMGSNLGWVPIDVEFLRTAGTVSGINREIFYARYIDWVITTPLLLTDLLLTAAMPWPTIVWVIFLDEAMIITGLIGALVKTRYKFGYFAIGCAAMLAVFWELGWTGRKHAKALGKDVHRVYVSCGVLTLFIWLLYPIAWGLCEGGNVISPDAEAIFYGILDLCAKPVFSAALIYGHWSISPARLGLQISEYGEPFVTSKQAEKERDEHDTTRRNLGQMSSNGLSHHGERGEHSTNLATAEAGYTTGRTPMTASGYAPGHDATTIVQ